MRTHLSFEREEGYPSLLVVGVDEVGRGCIAGPVVAGAVLLPPQESSFDLSLFPWLADVSDSKTLTPALRASLHFELRSWLSQYGGAFGIGEASIAEIDTINIFHASHLAMVRAVDAAAAMAGRSVSELHAVVDGKFLPKQWQVASARAIVKGDLQCFSIASASILAKVYRDGLLVEADSAYPGYGFAEHKGYGTPSHLSQLKAQGPCPLHRRSFAPVRAAMDLAQNL